MQTTATIVEIVHIITTLRVPLLIICDSVKLHFGSWKFGCPPQSFLFPTMEVESTFLKTPSGGSAPSKSLYDKTQI